MFQNQTNLNSIDQVILLISLYPCVSYRGIKRVLSLNGITITDSNLRSCLARAQKRKLIASEHVIKDAANISDKRHPYQEQKMFFATQKGIDHCIQKVNIADQALFIEIANKQHAKYNSYALRCRRFCITDIAVSNLRDSDISLIDAYYVFLMLQQAKVNSRLPNDSLLEKPKRFFIEKYLLESFFNRRSSYSYAGIRVTLTHRSISFDVVLDISSSQPVQVNLSMITFINKNLLRLGKAYNLGVSNTYGIITCFSLAKKAQVWHNVHQIFTDVPIKTLSNRYIHESEKYPTIRYSPKYLSETKSALPDKLKTKNKVFAQLCIGNFFIKEIIPYGSGIYAPFFVKSNHSYNAEINQLLNEMRCRPYE